MGTSVSPWRKALRSATGIGDDGEAADEEDGDGGHELNARDAGALTARLVKATRECDVVGRCRLPLSNPR
jgi:hypothetical protein